MNSNLKHQVIIYNNDWHLADVSPQFEKIANWYWEQAGGHAGLGMSIWELLERDYGAVKAFSPSNARAGMRVWFPDEKVYTLFLLRWA